MTISILEIDDYIEELNRLRPDDTVEYSDNCQGYKFLATAGHGFLCVPIGDINYETAKKIQSDGYGYKGKLAVYLEEDCQAGDFLNAIK